jgi:hypothetical protein
MSRFRSPRSRTPGSTISAPAVAENGRTVQDQGTFAFAFVSSSWTPHPQLTLQGGVRLSAENRDFTAERLVGPFGFGTLGPVTVILDDTNLSIDASAAWAFNRQASGGSQRARRPLTIIVYANNFLTLNSF